ncbi:MAG: hypothetical protein JRI22_22070 [Deltaproteobacteria bacterium]|nr:hypothetical protein [Deltaproteobacteria bacterium]
MTEKKDAKRRKRERREKNRRKARLGKGKSGQALLLEKMKKSKYLPGAKFVIEPNGKEKMSEVVLDFAKPLLDECRDSDTEKKAISLAILVWNMSLLPENSRDQAIQKMYSDLLPSDDATDLATMMYCVDMLMERKRKYFPKNKRAIIDYQFSGSGKDRRLDVASTLSH